MSTPLIPPPPMSPKKRTVNTRSRQETFRDLKRCAVHTNGGNFSHFVNEGLRRAIDQDIGSCC